MKRLIIIITLFVLVTPVLADDNSEGNWLSEWILDSLFKFWNWFSGLFIKIGAYVLEVMLSVIPENQLLTGEKLKAFLEIANVWVPIDYLVSLFSIWLTFNAIVAVMRLIVGFIPGVNTS